MGVHSDLVGRAGNGYSHVDVSSHGRGENAGVGAKRTYGAALGRGVQRAAAAMRERELKSLGSGAQALRKYACDAIAIWTTVYMIVKLRRKATDSGIAPHEKAKNKYSRSTRFRIGLDRDIARISGYSQLR
eukprot:6158232-Pleurochrysis_carterae.AAC.2